MKRLASFLDIGTGQIPRHGCLLRRSVSETAPVAVGHNGQLEEERPLTRALAKTAPFATDPPVASSPTKIAARPFSAEGPPTACGRVCAATPLVADTFFVADVRLCHAATQFSATPLHNSSRPQTPIKVVIVATKKV